MPLHYEHDGQPVGPVSDSEVEELIRAGTITPETLVWQTGMAGWQPYRTLARPAPVAAAAPGEVVCAECGRSFPPTEVISYDNLWVCAACKPVFFQRVKEGVRPGPQKVWASGNKLVVEEGAELPDRCVKCNAPADGRRLKRVLYWHPPLLYLLLLCNLLIFVIVAMVVRKRVGIQIGLCERHFLLRKRNLLISWLLALAGVVAIAAAIGWSNGWPGAAGGVLLLGAAIYGAVTVPMVAATRIKDGRAWVRGVCSDYLAALPSWTGE